jgi:hypothetical protein
MGHAYLCEVLDIRVKQSVCTWDKGTLGTKLKRLCLDLPRIGSRARRRTRTSTGYKTPLSGASGRPRIKFQEQVWIRYVASVLTLEAY